MSLHVLVTGAAGYLGSVLCEQLLDANYQVTALDNLRYGQNSLFHLCANPHFDFIFGDARNPELMQPLTQHADVIIPLAAIVGATACDRDPWAAKSTNLEAIQMLNQVRSPQQLLVYPNTNSGYGTQTGEIYCTEDTPLEPISFYGQTKVQAELELLASSNVITLRLATVFGMSPRMRLDLLVNHFTYAALFEGYITLFEKDFKRNYIHVRDVADAFIYVIEHADALRGRAYNAGLDAANFSKEELALKIKAYIPNFYIHAAPIGSDPDQRNYIVSNQRLREAGFEAKRTLDEGIQELIKGYRMLGRGKFKNV
ncbi:MAG: NAD(P)-dependent oxidoreductase [Spirulina sp. SIO3F2]|nr:NAD(P)-dependent oxidoreductase [Spirulina sp. SIO3F2]